MFKDLELLRGLKEATQELFVIIYVAFVQIVGADRLGGHTTVCHPLVQNVDGRYDLCKHSVEVSLELCLESMAHLASMLA
eukprot:13448738-Ditylum_brightwellii.AAC.1